MKIQRHYNNVNYMCIKINVCVHYKYTLTLNEKDMNINTQTNIFLPFHFLKQFHVCEHLFRNIK